MTPPKELEPLVLGLHHVAIVVASIAEARALYEGVFGMRPKGDVEHVPQQKVNVLVLYAGTQRIELVEPAAEDSPVSKFLARGGGIHHTAYEVADCAQALERLKAAGVELIHETPQPGSHGTTVAFLHPRATGKVLVEIVEDPSR